MQRIKSVPEPGTTFSGLERARYSTEVGLRAAGGDQVRVARGLLTGLVGNVREWTRECRCVLEVEGLPDGVWLVVDGEVLEAQGVVSRQ